MKNRKPKIYASTWYVIVGDQYGTALIKCKALTALSARKEYERFVSVMGGRIWAVLKAT